MSATYTASHRRLEIASIATFLIGSGILAGRLLRYSGGAGWLIAAAIFLGLIAADFVSGFVHWMADTWGSVETPFFGEALVRPFREHHTDQLAITRHDFIETNGNNSLVSLPVLGAAFCIPLDHASGLFAAALLWSLVLWVFGTNQFHKWAHQKERPVLVRWLQRVHLILPPDHHALHHRTPFLQHYCITTGWLNVPLAATKFFRALEFVVHKSTGMVPREDDLATVAKANRRAA